MNTRDLINNLKTCEYCNREFETPVRLIKIYTRRDLIIYFKVILPCGETCCKKHISDMFKEDHYNIIICFFCNEEHHYSDKKNFYPENKLINKLIDLNAKSLDIEKCITESVDSYEQLKLKYYFKSNKN